MKDVKYKNIKTEERWYEAAFKIWRVAQLSKKSENLPFICENCGKFVKMLTNGSFRNHCPFCLFSKHLDNKPGDRENICGGLMQPVGIRLSSKKGQQILHKCLRCGIEKLNKIALSTEQEDNMDLIIKLIKGYKL